MDSAKLDELEKVAEAVEPKAWHYQEESDAYTHIVRGPNNHWIVSTGQSSKGDDEALARYIAATSPDTILEMVRELRVLKRALELAAVAYVNFGICAADTEEQRRQQLRHWREMSELELGNR